jgi:hypothetical protein
VAPPVFKTRSQRSLALWEVTLVEKPRGILRSRFWWIMPWKLRVATQWALQREGQSPTGAIRDYNRCGSSGSILSNKRRRFLGERGCVDIADFS